MTMSKFKRDSAKVVGIRIGQIRGNLGLTMKDFGSLIDGTSGSLVSRWERGVNLPNSKRLSMIAELGKTTVDELLGTNSNKTVDEAIDELKSSFSEEEIKEIIRKLI